MGKLKKHELLTKAMRDYPAGTRFKSAQMGMPNVSTGQFEMSLGDNIVMTPRCDGGVIYSEGVWATIIHPEKQSLLSGKCAIQVNNEREFKLLMEHYDAKGWKLSRSYMYYGYPQTIYHNNENDGVSSGEQSAEITEKEGFCVIPFADFAAEVGSIKVPVFVMTSEDGVPLYEGDAISTYRNINGEWRLNCRQKIQGGFNVVLKPSEFKAFHSDEAAESWCNKHNQSFTTKDGVLIKYDQEYFAVDEDLAITRYILCSTPNGTVQFSTPELAEAFLEEEGKVKEIRIDYGCDTYCVVTEVNVKFSLIDGIGFELTSVQLEEIYREHQKLQPF